MAKKTEVIVSCNIRSAQEAQKILVRALTELKKNYDALVAAGKQNDEEAKKLKKDMDALASAVETNENAMTRIQKVMDNLAGSTLRQLNSALRDVKKQMNAKSTNSADLEDLQKKFNAITEQIKILKGETVNLEKGIDSLSSQTDAWLTKAIAKQKELVAQTQRGTQAYAKQKSDLERLEKEQRDRQFNAISAKGNAAMTLANTSLSTATMTQLREARQNLVAYRDNIGASGINLGSAKTNTDTIEKINGMLKAIDAQIDSIIGKGQKVGRTVQEIVQDINGLDFRKVTPKELKDKLDEVNAALSNMGKNDPMRSQLVQSAKKLQSELDILDGKVVDVEGCINSLGTQTDSWLAKAIAKQRELVAQTQQGTQAYLQQKDVLNELEKEQGKRQLQSISVRGRDALRKETSLGEFSLSQLRSVRQDLVTYRDNIGTQGINYGSAKANAAQIERINNILKDVDARIDSINGKSQKTAMTAQQLVQHVRQMDFSSVTPKELKEKLEEINRELSTMRKNDPLRDGLIDSARKLQTELDIIDGKYVDVSQGINNLAAQTDSWLTKAIARQKELVAQTQQGTQAYIDQEKRLKELEREQKNRQLKTILDKGNAAMKIAQDPTDRSMSEMRQARQDLVNYRDNIGFNGLDFGSEQDNIAMIQQINALLKSIDTQIDSINGKVQNVALSAQRIVQEINQMDFEQATPNQLKAKLDEVNKVLADMGKNDPMRSQLVQSAEQLQNALEEVQGKVVDVSAVLADLNNASPKDLQAALDQTNKRLDRLGQNDANRKKLLQDAEKLRNALNRVRAVTVDVDDVLRRLKSAPLEELKKAASQLEQEIGRLNRISNANEIENKKKQLRQLKEEIQKVTGAVSKQESSWKKTFQAITAYMGETMVIGKIQSMLQSVFNLNLKFSDQLADIRKVSGLAMKDINQLSNRLASIDTRTTIEELNQISYAGAKLGIGKYGIEGLEGFTRAANQVNVALKEDLGEDALTALSKITEVMGLIPKMGVEKSMLATGSAMFQLSATSTATAGNIVEFSKRLTGLAKVTGITTDQLLGLASASDAMFLMPEVASTAFNKLFTSLQTKHNLIEKELAIEPGTINELYKAGHAMDAIVLIFEKMKEKGNMNALQGIFKDLGSDGARLVNVMVTMAQNIDMLKDHLEIAKDSFEEATAVTNEYNIQQETAQAYMERASNVWEKAFVNAQGVDAVKKFSQMWYEVSKSLTESQWAMSGFNATLTIIINALKLAIKLLPVLITFMMFKGVASVLMGLRTAYLRVAAAIQETTIKQLLLNAAQKANFWIALATAVVSLTMALYDFCFAADKAATSQKKINEYLIEAETEYQKQKNTLKSYLSVLEDVNTSTDQRSRLLRKFNKEFQPYLDKLGIEVKTVQDLKDNYQALNDEIRKKMYYQMREKAYTDYLETDVDENTPSPMKRMSEALMGYGGFISMNERYKAYDTKWLEEQVDNGRDAKSIAEGMVRQMYPGLMSQPGYYGDMDYYYTDENGKQVRLETPEHPMVVQRYIQDYIDAKDAYEKRKSYIDSAFDPILHDYDPSYDVDLGDLNSNAPDKDAKRQSDEQRKRWREELKQAQDEARAIMDNIRNFYQRQITQILRTANEQNWDESLIKSVTDALLARQNLALSQARKGIAGVRNEWEEFKTTMQEDMIETQNDVGYNESQVLLDLVTSNNLEALHEKINGLAKQVGMPANAATDAIWKNATLNEKANETATQRHQREKQKLLLTDNYTAKVDSDYAASMTRLGYFDINEEQSQTLIGGGKEAEELLERRNQEIVKVFQNARARLTDLIAIDNVATDRGRISLLEILFGPNWDMDESELKEVFMIAGEDLKQFYDELIKYDNDYLDAQKKAEDRAKKLIDFQWERSEPKKNLDIQEQNVDMYQKGLLQHFKPDEADKLPGYGVYGNTRFVSDFGVDPEIESYKLKMEAARAYYDFLEAHGATAQQLREQEKSVIAAQAEYVQQLASRIKRQMDEVLQMHEPIVDFGSKAGEAFALMTEDAEAGRKALKAALGDMINDFMKQTVEMTKEYIKRRIMQKAHDKLTSLEASAHEAELTQIQSTGDMSRLTLHEAIQTGLTNIDQTQAAVRETTNIEEQTTELSTDAAAVGPKVAIGTAAGAAKTIGSLGWWGIPLVAVITALLGGLLSFAMSKVSKFFGGASTSETGPQTKLVSGMLTYDSGNVQAFRGVEDGKTYPVVGSDGKVYAAKDGGELSTGLVKDPITTLVNGQPALVAEKGPEMVIGRETTAAMMMARPDILAEIVKFDRQRSGRTYRAYDAGNLNELQISMSAQEGNAEELAQLRDTLTTLSSVLAAIQKNGIQASINKFGRGGVADAAKSGSKFMQRNSSDPLWKP